MSDHRRGHREYRQSRWRCETLDDWENEGGSLCPPPAAGPPASETCPGPLGPQFDLLEALPLGVLITDRNGEITYSNPASHILYAASPTKLLGTAWYRDIDARDRAAVPDLRQDDNDNKTPRTCEVRLVTGSGRRIWTRHTIARLSHRTGTGAHIHTIEDISGSKAAEQAGMDTLEVLSVERERARVTLECIGDAVISTDTEGQVTYLNAAAEYLTGWSREEARGRPLDRVFRVIDADTGQAIHNPAERAMESLGVVKTPVNSLLSRPDGSELAIEDSAAPILDRTGRLTGAVVIFRDRSFSRQSIERMAYLARHDALTGLPNRIAFAEEFERAVNLARRHGGRIGLLFIDLDHFKQVNDRLGHKAGDQVLRELSRKLVTCVRSTDLVCRYGGDEFVALLGDIREHENIGRVAVKMRAAAASLLDLQEHTPGLELSIGVSVYPEDGADMEALVRRADIAMYHAKLDAKKDLCFYRAGTERPGSGSHIEEAPI